MNNTFPKREHLCGVKTIERLYTQGSAFVSFPFRVVYLDVSGTAEETPVRIMVSVSKKKFKKAVMRNRIKRLMRESYRLHKTGICEFCTIRNINLHIAFQYISNDMESFETVHKKMNQTLEKLVRLHTENTKISDENG